MDEVSGTTAAPDDAVPDGATQDGAVPHVAVQTGRFPTARDVALRAGVSASTVSRVLNATTPVRADKCRAVMQAAAALGFVANGAARALSTFQERLRRDGYTLVVTGAGYDLDRELLEATFLLEHGIDGLMLVGDIHRPALLERIERQGIPLVQTFSLSRQRGCVGFDNEAAAARATDYLLDLGHRRFGVITGPRAENDRGGARVQGVLRSLAARSLAIAPEHDIEVTYGIRDGRDALRQILSGGEPVPTAILCGTDQLAFGAMIEAHARGIDIPGELSVVGFNDADYAAFLRPPLTTLRLPSAEIGMAAAEHLLARMAGRATVRVVELEPQLVVRASTGPPPRPG